MDSHSRFLLLLITDRRWVIKMIAGNCSNLQEIMERESELVKKLAEVLCWIIL